ncbi:hypothetical protein AX15_004696 [Amanita polypyramis BW_CC]|nr:hypothetical protein AX15_004696 [Amanita polypyramis BW_CC]
MPTQIRQLLDILSKSVATLEAACAANGAEIPDLTNPFHPDSEAFREDPAAAEAANLIGAAALQLAATVIPPQISLYHIVGGHWKSAALRVCLESNVTEILREAGPEGLHVNDIVTRSGLDPNKLGRCLRILATHHVYREVKPDVFANTRISSMLDTMKPSDAIFSDPEHKHDDTNGLPAFVGHHLDETFKGSAYLWEVASDPKTAKSGDPASASLGRGISNGKILWDFFGQPDQTLRQRRFDVAMRGVQAMLPSDVVPLAFDWKSLPENALVVDVGGGIGTASRALVQQFSNLRIVVQDLPLVIENGIKDWKQQMPNELASGRVKFEVHDFFKSQPQTNASVFLLKHILHDWSDEYSLKILKQLREAATPQTRIICVESILPYACHGLNVYGDIPGAAPKEAPAPLLANWGAVNEMIYNLDMVMLLLFNSTERTIHQFDSLFKRAGWQIKVINRAKGKDTLFVSAIEAVPIPPSASSKY